MIDATIREMVRRDLPRVLSLSRDNMASIIFSSWGVDFRDEDVLHFIMEPTAFTEVVELDGEIIGYYTVDMAADNLFVSSIQVKREHQNQGLGTALMARIEDLARSRGASTIELWAQVTNKPAIRFYRHRGYRVVSRQGNNYLMRKVVGHDEEGAAPPRPGRPGDGGATQH